MARQRGLRVPLRALLLPLLAVISCADAHLSSYQRRRLLVRDIPGGQQVERPRCQNTAQGWRFLADSEGNVCTRQQMDYSSGCCKGGKRHSCDTCKLTDKCCSEYEFCVSCCLAPEHGAEQVFSKTLRAPKNPSAGTWPSAWEHCRGICRTHSASTMHENAYISARHHCFSTLGRPLLSDPLPPGALDGVTVIMSAAGESCDDACGKQSDVCSATHLAVINSCDKLRELVGCEAGCEGIALPGGSAPAYMDAGAPKASRPAMCFTQPAPAAASEVKCGGKDAGAKRLCACTRKQRRRQG